MLIPLNNRAPGLFSRLSSNRARALGWLGILGRFSSSSIGLNNRGLVYSILLVVVLKLL